MTGYWQEFCGISAYPSFISISILWRPSGSGAHGLSCSGRTTWASELGARAWNSLGPTQWTLPILIEIHKFCRGINAYQFGFLFFFFLPLVNFQIPEMVVLDNFVQFYCGSGGGGFTELLTLGFWKSCNGLLCLCLPQTPLRLESFLEHSGLLFGAVSVCLGWGRGGASSMEMALWCLISFQKGT